MNDRAAVAERNTETIDCGTSTYSGETLEDSQPHLSVFEKTMLVHRTDGRFYPGYGYRPSMHQRFPADISSKLKSSLQGAVKRMFDSALALILLPVLLAAIGIIGLIVKIDSRGPVFYRHTRVGRSFRRIGV